MRTAALLLSYKFAMQMSPLSPKYLIRAIGCSNIKDVALDNSTVPSTIHCTDNWWSPFESVSTVKSVWNGAGLRARAGVQIGSS